MSTEQQIENGISTLNRSRLIEDRNAAMLLDRRVLKWAASVCTPEASEIELDLQEAIRRFLDRTEKYL